MISAGVRLQEAVAHVEWLTESGHKPAVWYKVWSADSLRNLRDYTQALDWTGPIDGVSLFVCMYYLYTS